MKKDDILIVIIRNIEWNTDMTDSGFSLPKDDWKEIPAEDLIRQYDLTENTDHEYDISIELIKDYVAYQLESEYGVAVNSFDCEIQN